MKQLAKENFLTYDFINYPYVIPNRGPSTQFNESLHFKNSNTGRQLNIFLDKQDGTISIGLHDKSMSPRLRTKRLYSSVVISEEKLKECFGRLNG